MNIAVLNGPNLNLLGSREPQIYGTTTLPELEARLRDVALELGVTVVFTQQNGEGELVNAIQQLKGKAAGAIINAGAYSHTSLAIRDAFGAIGLPYVEVHISNVYAREPERRRSVLAAGAVAVIAGLGVLGYELALRGLVDRLRAARA
ncbi:MAG: type II 3-dehydroquinate dehydratase [Gemmatimonadaceae bacterium]